MIFIWIIHYENSQQKTYRSYLVFYLLKSVVILLRSSIRTSSLGIFRSWATHASVNLFLESPKNTNPLGFIFMMPIKSSSLSWLPLIEIYSILLNFDNEDTPSILRLLSLILISSRLLNLPKANALTPVSLILLSLTSKDLRLDKVSE